MPNSRRPKTGGCMEMLTGSSIAASGVRDVERTEEVMSERDTTAVDQRSIMAEPTDSEMYFADVADKDCDSDVSTNSTNLHMQRGSGFSEMALSDNVASTLEWRKRVLQSQKSDAQAIASSSRQRQTAEERWHAKMEAEIAQIRQRFQEEEEMLEKQIVNLEEAYKSQMKQLEEEENDEQNYYVGELERWEVQSDYQPTECGDDGSGYAVPEKRH